MAIEKKLNTRIALKYDTYEHWTTTSQEDKGANFVLLPGEVGICEIPGETETIDGLAITTQTTTPTILFKVGDGFKKFSELPWISAKAADVADWAKSSNVELTNGSLQFITGDTVNKTIDFTKQFATQSEFYDLIMRVATLEGAGGNTNASSSELATAINNLTKQVTTNTTTLTELTGDSGPIKSLQTDVKTLKANSDTQTQEIATISGRVDTVEATIKTLQGLTGDYSGLIQSVETAIQTSNDAKTAVSGLANAVDGLTQDVAANTETITQIQTNYLTNTDTFIFNCDDVWVEH